MQGQSEVILFIVLVFLLLVFGYIAFLKWVRYSYNRIQELEFTTQILRIAPLPTPHSL